MNAAVASCRPNLNTGCHVCVLCTHNAQISVQTSDNLNVMLKHFPQTHQASSMLVPSISFPFQITAYLPIHYHSTSRDTSSYPNTSSSVWNPVGPHHYHQNLVRITRQYSQTTSTNTAQYSHSLKLTPKTCGETHFYWPGSFASTASTTWLMYFFLCRLH
jgi:hypothetical protein